MPSAEEYRDVAEAAEDTAEALLKRGNELLKMGQRLLSMAAELGSLGEGGAVSPSDAVEQRSVGKQGVVTVGIATEAAKRLGTFTRAEFSEVLGLNAGATSKWINLLSTNKPWPIVRRVQRGQYKYIGPEDKPADPTEAPEHASAVEASAGVGADRQSTGAVVAFTGRAMGSTGKPGLDKKLSKQRRIKRKSGQVIGGRG